MPAGASETVVLCEEPENPEIQILENSADNEIECLGIVKFMLMENL